MWEPKWWIHEGQKSWRDEKKIIDKKGKKYEKGMCKKMIERIMKECSIEKGCGMGEMSIEDDEKGMKERGRGNM